MAGRLSGMDAVALSIESATLPAHVVAVVVLDASDELSHAGLHELMGSSLSTMARFRSRLVDKPLGWGQPVWCAIDDFDPGPHLRSATLPASSGQRGFHELIARLSAEPLSRRRPLWELWTIDGLDAGRWALALKIAPAITGGVIGLTAVWRRLLGTRPHDAPAAHQQVEPASGAPPSFGGLIADTVREVVENQIAGALLVAGAVPGVVRAALRTRRDDSPGALPRTPSSMRGPVPRTPFNTTLTKRRAVAFASVPLSDINTVTRAFGGTADNVVLAACTLSLRAWLARYDRVPDHPLSLRVPLFMPKTGIAGLDGQFMFGRLRFPVQLDDPVRVLTDLHTATEKLKMARGDGADAGDNGLSLTTVAPLIPPHLVRAGMRLYSGLGLAERIAPISQGVVSTLPVLRVPLYCAGVKVVGMHAVAPLIEGAGLNITLITQGAAVHVSVCVCPDNISGVDQIAGGIAESVGILAAAAADSPRGVSPSVVTEINRAARSQL